MTSGARRSWPPGTYSCPDDNGQTFTLTFRAHPGGPALATAVLALTGCGGTALTVGAKENELGLESARPLATKVLEVAGVPWKLSALPVAAGLAVRRAGRVCRRRPGWCRRRCR
ncbi:MAG: hypothetical protein ABSB76_39820, partial [Streptosporangiaceae bacterium]